MTPLTPEDRKAANELAGGATARPIHYMPEIGPRSICAARVESSGFGKWTADARNVTCPMCAGLLITSLWKAAGIYAFQSATVKESLPVQPAVVAESATTQPATESPDALWPAINRVRGLLIDADIAGLLPHPGPGKYLLSALQYYADKHLESFDRYLPDATTAAGQTAQEPPDLDERKRWREFHAAQEPKQ